MEFLKKIVTRIAAIVVLAEVIYLALANLALNVSLTQDMVNRIRPDKLTVGWDGGWTWFPGRVNVSGIKAGGQTRKQQWRVWVSEAVGRVALSPLLTRTVDVSGVEAVDVAIFMEPRSGSGADNETGVSPGEAGAAGRTQSSGMAEPGGRRKPWQVAASDIRITGSHRVQVGRLGAAFTGNAGGDFSIQAPRGPLALSDGKYDVSVRSVVQGGNRVVVDNAQGSEKIRIQPVDPREHRGAKIRNFIELDGDIREKADSLAVLNAYLRRIQGIPIDGAGVVEGRVVMDRGELRPGTDLRVSADDLDLHVIDLQIEGDGGISIAVPDDAGGFVRLAASGVRSRLDDQELSGNLTAHITLAGGMPRYREFDVSGSTLVLDGVRVIGEEESFRDEDWSANIELTKARAIWKTPLNLDVDAEISMSDSMPIVSILANERGKPGWLEEAMTIDDVHGTARVGSTIDTSSFRPHS